MVAERKLERSDVAQCPGRLNAGCGIVDPDRRACVTKSDRDAVLATQAFTPHDELERAITVLQEQLMNSFGLVRDREVQLPGFGYGTFVRQDGREVVKIDRGLAG